MPDPLHHDFRPTPPSSYPSFSRQHRKNTDLPPVAQKTFLALRTLANRHQTLTCLAISHSSPAATNKWLDLLGGPWSVTILHDDDLSLYATWGLGSSTLWSVLNPATQLQGWREKGWLGSKVAEGVRRRAAIGEGEETEGMVLGNKWLSAGAWAVNGKGVVVWGGRAERADDVMDLEEGVRALGLRRGLR